MTRGRLVLVVLVLGVAGFGLAALPWLQLAVPTVIARQDVDVAGTTAVPVVGPLSLAVLAAALAVAIGATWARRVAGVVLVALGVLMAAMTVRLLLDPQPIAVAAALAVSGVPQIDGPVTVTPWPYLTVLLGIAIAVGGVLALLVRPPATAGRRYERGQATTGPGSAAEPTTDAGAEPPRVRAMDDWDALGRGEDPTDPDHG